MTQGIIAFAKAMSFDYETVDDLVDELLIHVNSLDLSQHDNYVLGEIIVTVQEEVDEYDVHSFVNKFCKQVKNLSIISSSYEEDDLSNSRKAKKLMG